MAFLGTRHHRYVPEMAFLGTRHHRYVPEMAFLGTRHHRYVPEMAFLGTRHISLWHCFHSFTDSMRSSMSSIFVRKFINKSISLVFM